jgi:hypothetical protein
LAIGSGLAVAATQGTLGASSSGTVTINSTKGAAVQISGLSDFTFPPSATTPAPIEQTACVYSTTGAYTVVATSSHAAGGSFRLNNGASFINYEVNWYGVASGGTASSLSSGTQSGNQAGADTTSTSCGGGADSRIGIAIDAVSFTAAPAGTYSDTLTLLVAPV